MRSRLYAGLSLLLVAATPLCAQAAQDPVPAAAAMLLWGEPSAAVDRGDVQRVALNDGVFVERLKGEAALAHVYNVMSRRPDAFRAASRALKERGFEPTNTIYVERTIRLAKNPTGSNGSMTLPAQTHSEQNSDGEIIFWSWNDGNNATWEGEIYIEVYSANAASTWEGQIDASTQQHPWVYYRKMWEGGGGGPLPTSLEGRPPHPGAFAGAVPAVLLGHPGASGGGYALAASFHGWAYCWRRCVVTGCGTSAVGCLASGPAWPECFAAWCIGSEIACGVACMIP